MSFTCNSVLEQQSLYSNINFAHLHRSRWMGLKEEENWVKMTEKYNYLGLCSKEYWINISTPENRNKINIYVPVPRVNWLKFLHFWHRNQHLHKIHHYLTMSFKVGQRQKRYWSTIKYLFMMSHNRMRISVH